jgi:hypothetical protein
MKDRNPHPFTQLLLDVEALRRLDVFEVDATKGRLQGGDDLNQAIGVAFLDFEVEHVDIGKLLEQHRLTFHHWLGSQRTDRTQAKNRRAIGNYADQVGPRSKGARFTRKSDNLFAGSSHSRRVSH